MGGRGAASWPADEGDLTQRESWMMPGGAGEMKLERAASQ